MEWKIITLNDNKWEIKVFDMVSESEDLEQLHSIVVDKIGKIDGIQNTETFVELDRTEKSPMYLSS